MFLLVSARLPIGATGGLKPPSLRRYSLAKTGHWINGYGGYLILQRFPSVQLKATLAVKGALRSVPSPRSDFQVSNGVYVHSQLRIEPERLWRILSFESIRCTTRLGQRR